MHPGDIVPAAFNGGLVVLSFVTAFLGAYVALAAGGRLRLGGEAGVHFGYVATCALALGGVGVWGMHFIGLQARLLPFAVGHDTGLTVIGLCVAVGFAGFALWYAGSEPLTARRCLAGGVLAGTGIAAMHYIGMAAMRMPALLQWSLPLVMASVAIAMAASTAALWLVFRARGERQRLAGALALAGAFCAMHYVGEAAATVIGTAAAPYVDRQLKGQALPYVVFAACGLVLFILSWQLHRGGRPGRDGLRGHGDFDLIDGGSGHAG